MWCGLLNTLQNSAIFSILHAEPYKARGMIVWFTRNGNVGSPSYAMHRRSLNFMSRGIHSNKEPSRGCCPTALTLATSFRGIHSS